MNDLFNQMITIENPDTIDSNGVYAYLTPSTVKARVQLKNLVVLNSQGESILADGIAYIAASPVVKLRARVMYDGEKFQVVQQKGFSDFFSLQHQKIWLQRLSQM